MKKSVRLLVLAVLAMILLSVSAAALADDITAYIPGRVSRLDLPGYENAVYDEYQYKGDAFRTGQDGAKTADAKPAKPKAKPQSKPKAQPAPQESKPVAKRPTQAPVKANASTKPAGREGTMQAPTATSELVVRPAWCWRSSRWVPITIPAMRAVASRKMKILSGITLSLII